MSGHWRLCVGVLLFAGLSTLPAYSNPFTDLFNPAPKEEAAPAPANPPAPARVACLAQPGRSSAPGLHWVYHLEGHRKCWYQRAERAVSTRSQAHYHFVKRHAAPEEAEDNEAELRKQSVANARAQLLRPSQADAFRMPPTAPEVDDDAPAAADTPTSRVPPIPVVAERTIDPPAPIRDAPRPVDVEKLLAADSVDSDTLTNSVAKDAAASSVPVAAPVAFSIPYMSPDRWEAIISQAGTALIGLGLLALAGSLLVRRMLNRRIRLTVDPGMIDPRMSPRVVRRVDPRAGARVDARVDLRVGRLRRI